MDVIDPFDTLLRLQRALDTPRADRRPAAPTGGAGAFPPVNVFQRGSDFVLMAELPGLDQASLSVEVQRNQVRLAGRRPPASDAGRSYHRRERAVGEFDRTITLPSPISADTATASYDQGVLTVTLPPADAARPRVVPVR